MVSNTGFHRWRHAQSLVNPCKERQSSKVFFVNVRAMQVNGNRILFPALGNPKATKFHGVVRTQSVFALMNLGGLNE
jgi:hypothetical protein